MAGSYLGHGAKYWADRYFELRTQTRLPDDPADLSWRDKYIALEKECSHYQATLSEMRVEIEDLRSKIQTPKPESQAAAEKWENAYWKLYNTLKAKENQCNALTAENLQFKSQLQSQLSTPLELYNGQTAEWWYNAYQSACQEREKYRSQIRPLTNSLRACKDSSEIGGHDAVYWCGQSQNLEKKLSKKESQILVILTAAFVIVAAISVFGFMAGSGYFVPYYVPDSPYIDSLKSAENSAYSNGYKNGYTSGQLKGYNSGFNAGQSDGYEACRLENQSIRNEYDSGYSAGYDVGWDNGWDAGRDDGLADRSQDAYNEGYDAGYSDCFDEYN